MDTATETRIHREPWNKGKLVGQKAPFKLKDIWALRVRPVSYTHLTLPTSDLV